MTPENEPGLDYDLRRRMAEVMAARGGYVVDPDPLIVAEPEPEPSALQLTDADLLAECSRQPETDIGLGTRLIIRYGEILRHVTHVGWHGFDGKRWMEDASGAFTRQLAHKTAIWIDDEAIELECNDEEKAKIEAGRIALVELKKMGDPTLTEEAEAEESAEDLDALIAAGQAAQKTKARLGSPNKSWTDAMHAELQAAKVAIKDGQDAERRKRKQGAGQRSWDEHKIRDYERLTKDAEAFQKVQSERDGRISSRHTFAKSAAGTNRINNMLSEALPYLAIDVDDLNRDLHALNTRSGTLRFFRPAPGEPWTVRHDHHRASDFISKLAEVDFDKQATCPLFLQFLQRIMPDADIRAFLQRYFGYALLGVTVEQCLVFFYGIGRNGKSTLVDLIVELMGDYAVSMSIDSFAGDSRRSGAEATPDLARLPGARLVAASEPESGVNLKDALIKSLTGGEVISVRRLHQDFFELKPQFKIVLSGNHKPVIRDDSDGIWRRVFLVPFDVQIPESEVDPDLPQKLRREAAGIFAWMVRGAIDYLNRGLAVPDKVRAATAEYREESDPIGAFLRNGCDITGDANDREFPLDLFKAFCVFVKREGLSDFKQSTFSKRLPDQARKSWLGPDGHMHQFMKVKSGTTVYTGIRIREEFRAPSEEPGGRRYGPADYDDDPFRHEP